MDSWMDWDGWHWVALVMALANGIGFGWSIRGTHERAKNFRREMLDRRVRIARERSETDDV